MLEQLHIKNVALIQESELHFEQGLNILTGETGAGKSMVIDSLHFALGGKVSKDFLRKDAQSAIVEALFVTNNPKINVLLEENGVESESDGSLLISRTMQASGRTVARINGTMVTTTMLKALSGELLDIYGQHEHQSLLNPSKHIELLDRFCGESFLQIKQEYRTIWAEQKQLQKQLQLLCGTEQSRAQRLDLLRFQKQEIESASLHEGEEEILSEQKKKLSSMEKLIHASMSGVQILYDGTQEQNSVYDNLGKALECLEYATTFDSTLQNLCEQVQELYTQLEDVAREWKRYTQYLEEEPDALDEIEQRLQLLYQLKRKYGSSISEILEFYETVCKELELLENSEEIAAKLEQQIAQLQQKLEQLAEKLTQIRTKTALQVSHQVEESLHDLQMSQAKFQIQITSKPQFTSDGMDHVEFLIAANAGEDLKPLSKIASGGEMSRVMLSLKTVLVDADEIGTFIFDEIDTGVSGKTARKVGEKMRVLGQKRQILCITHLPQIAAMADCHYLIEKNITDGRTITTVEKLNESDSCKEVARLMGGSELTEATLAAAKELCAKKI